MSFLSPPYSTQSLLSPPVCQDEAARSMSPAGPHLQSVRAVRVRPRARPGPLPPLQCPGEGGGETGLALTLHPPDGVYRGDIL